MKRVRFFQHAQEAVFLGALVVVSALVASVPLLVWAGSPLLVPKNLVTELSPTGAAGLGSGAVLVLGLITMVIEDATYGPLIWRMPLARRSVGLYAFNKLEPWQKALVRALYPGLFEEDAPLPAYGRKGRIRGHLRLIDGGDPAPGSSPESVHREVPRLEVEPRSVSYKTRMCRGLGRWFNLLEVPASERASYVDRWTGQFEKMQLLLGTAVEKGCSCEEPFERAQWKYHLFGATRASVVLGCVAGFGYAAAMDSRSPHIAVLPLATCGLAIITSNILWWARTTYLIRRRQWDIATEKLGGGLRLFFLQPVNRRLLEEMVANLERPSHVEGKVPGSASAEPRDTVVHEDG